MCFEVYGPYYDFSFIPKSIGLRLLEFPILFLGHNQSVFVFKTHSLVIKWKLSQRITHSDILVGVAYDYTLHRARQRYDSDRIFEYIMWRYEDLSDGKISCGSIISPYESYLEYFHHYFK